MNICEMDKDTAQKLGVYEEWKKAVRQPRTTKFTNEQVRSNSMRVLNVIAGLTQSERARVLAHAIKLNEV